MELGQGQRVRARAGQQANRFEIVALLTTVTDTYGRVSMHGVREELLHAQARATGLPLVQVRIPAPCDNAEYEERIGAALAGALAGGVDTMVFGDLYLADIREYREKQLAKVGMRAEFPLWKMDTRTLAREMIDAGVRAVLTCVDPQADPPRAGRARLRRVAARRPARDGRPLRRERRVSHVRPRGPRAARAGRSAAWAGRGAGRLRLRRPDAPVAPGMTRAVKTGNPYRSLSRRPRRLLFRPWHNPRSIACLRSCTQGKAAGSMLRPLVRARAWATCIQEDE